MCEKNFLYSGNDPMGIKPSLVQRTLVKYMNMCLRLSFHLLLLNWYCSLTFYLRTREFFHDQLIREKNSQASLNGWVGSVHWCKLNYSPTQSWPWRIMVQGNPLSGWSCKHFRSSNLYEGRNSLGNNINRLQWLGWLIKTWNVRRMEARSLRVKRGWTCEVAQIGKAPVLTALHPRD